MHSSSHGFQSKIAGAALLLMLATLWLLLRGYHGLIGDAQIYAFQAFAKIHSQLAADLYLQNISQDRFSVFSHFYAYFARILDLETAARVLTLLFTAWYLVAAWYAARAVSQREVAWLAVAFLLIIPGTYGGSGVFGFSEQYLTARLPAEALIVTAFACHFHGRKWIAVGIAAVAMFVHPLIALPGLLFLICLSLPQRVGAAGAIAGISGTLIISAGAITVPWVSHVFPVMDPTWLEVVQERSQFLFLPLWSYRDWELNARPFLYLGFIAIAVQDDRLRNFCVVAALVGFTGLAVALISSAIGPIALLVQGQAWRWMWIPAFMSALIFPISVLQVWRDEKCGPLCVVLLAAGWLWSAVDGTVCVSLALILWALRAHVGKRLQLILHLLAVAVGTGIIAWTLVQAWKIATPVSTAANSVAIGALPSPAQIRDIFGLGIPAALCISLMWWSIRSTRRVWISMLLSAALLASCILLIPSAFHQSRVYGTPAAAQEFADWQSVIPATSTVLLVPARDVGGFVWFTLQRPNYLAINQSAGVVFSRATALEVKRRSEVLTPLMDPNWRIMTRLRKDAAPKHVVDAVARPLSSAILAQICSDPALGFVISQQNVGFESLRRGSAGAFKDWNLYDCRFVRPIVPTK